MDNGNVDLAALGLVEEEVPQAVDWNAPEAGQFPPRLLPGDFEFVFALADEKPFDSIEITIDKATGAKAKFLNVTYNALVQVTDPSRLLNPDSPPEDGVVKIGFQRASDFQSQKMRDAGMLSGMADLCRSLGVRPEPWSRANAIAALREASGRASGSAFIGWEMYCKTCNAVTVSTKPRKARDGRAAVAAWPRTADRKFVALAACPGCGAKGYGREFVQALHIARGPVAQAPASSSPGAATPKLDDSSLL